MKKKAYVIGHNWQVAHLFEQLGYAIVDSADEADLLVFTGGADVTPRLYGEGPHRTTCNDIHRDMVEKAIYDEYVGKVPMVGICRGGQFLHVMNGGSMWQDVDNHAISGTHVVRDTIKGFTYQCTSTHHQMMRGDAPGCIILGVGTESRTTYLAAGEYTLYNNTKDFEDIEVVWHPDTRCLSFQPHPEYDVNGETRQFFEALLKRLDL